jgi:hypothetical protein
LIQPEWSETMKRAEKVSELQIERPPRAKLSPAESLKRMKGFDRRKEQFVAAVRKSKDRSLPA